MWKPDVEQTRTWYNNAKIWFAILPTVAASATFLINAPFGRFSPKKDSIFLVDGIKSWILMELMSPSLFVYTYVISPLSSSTTSISSLSSPSSFFATLFLTHYLNRALISPIRTPSRSRSHIIVPLLAALFNTVNGALLGTYFSSPPAKSFLAGAQSRPLFWIGVGMWAAGFAGNILHDEVLLNIRRKGKSRAQEQDGKSKDKDKGKDKPHYSIPHGYLYEYISYPNYFCEWIEWLGFALASSPFPSLASGGTFLESLTPPWLFFMAEIFTMLPRAYKGHRWYHEKFPDYPKERKAVVPFVF